MQLVNLLQDVALCGGTGGLSQGGDKALDFFLICGNFSLQAGNLPVAALPAAQQRPPALLQLPDKLKAVFAQML